MSHNVTIPLLAHHLLFLNKMFESWINSACSKLDEVGCSAFRTIAEEVGKSGNQLEEGDYTYVHRKDGSKVKLGRFLRKIDENLARDYARHKQQIKYRREGLMLHISQNPEDILAKSTGQGWTSCETVGREFAGGIFDDIKANNAIAYLTVEGKPNKWLGRRMIRWCIREDDEKPDAVIENYYGDQNYSDTTYRKLQEILQKHGFSGVTGSVACVTPYTYRGYVDVGRKIRRGYSELATGHNIQYDVGGRG